MSCQVAGKQMVGVYLSIWVRRAILPHVHGIQVTSIGTGVLGYLGNKGDKGFAHPGNTHLCLLHSMLVATFSGSNLLLS